MIATIIYSIFSVIFLEVGCESLDEQRAKVLLLWPQRRMVPADAAVPLLQAMVPRRVHLRHRRTDPSWRQVFANEKDEEYS